MKNATLTIRMHEEFREKLDALSKEYDWSLANIVERLIKFQEIMERFRDRYRSVADLDPSAAEEMVPDIWEEMERYMEGGLLCGKLPDDVDREEILGLKALQGGWEN